MIALNINKDCQLLPIEHFWASVKRRYCVIKICNKRNPCDNYRATSWLEVGLGWGKKLAKSCCWVKQVTRITIIVLDNTVDHFYSLNTAKPKLSLNSPMQNVRGFSWLTYRVFPPQRLLGHLNTGFLPGWSSIDSRKNMSIALKFTGHVTLKLQFLGIFRDGFQDPHESQNVL